MTTESFDREHSDNEIFDNEIFDNEQVNNEQVDNEQADSQKMKEEFHPSESGKPQSVGRDHDPLDGDALDDDALDLDALVLDRLVDNDLSATEYREVLRVVEEKPDGWRKLALAFLESQALENDLKSLCDLPDRDLPDRDLPDRDLPDRDLPDRDLPDPSIEPRAESVGFAIDMADADRRGSGSEVVSSKLDHTQSKEQKGLTKRFGWGVPTSDLARRVIPAIAACGVVAMLIGVFLSQIGDSNRRPGNVATLPGGERSEELNSNSGPDFIRLVGNQGDDSLEAPVYDHAQFDPQQAADQIESLSPKLQEVLTSTGYRTQERTHVMPIRDKTGNRIILPIKEFEIRPESWEDYQ